MINTRLGLLTAVSLGLAGFAPAMKAQTFTDGVATLSLTLIDYVGTTGDDHYTVGWVTQENGAFIKTLWKQGPYNNWTSSEWANHLGVWNTARNGSQVLDGWSGATARDYTASTNNPVFLIWDGRDATGNLVADGNYKFWVQYAENSGQGPHTTNGLLWAKGPAPLTNSYANVAGNFSNLRVTWNLRVEPEITTVGDTGGQVALSGTATPYSKYRVLTATNIAQPIGEWVPVRTNSADANGNFSYTDPINAGVPGKYYQLRSP